MLVRFVCRPACMKVEQQITSSVNGPARGRPGDLEGVFLFALVITITKCLYFWFVFLVGCFWFRIFPYYVHAMS